MNLLCDTNILLHLVRMPDSADFIDRINPLEKEIYVSIVSIGEIKSLAIQNKWGRNKYLKLESIIEDLYVIEITDDLINSYVAIDSFSQKQNPHFDSYSFSTPRNMGKNDLWIAATASFLDLKLITTDADFDHLNDVIFKVNRIVI